MRIINLEKNYPRVEEALKQLLAEFSTALVLGEKTVKVIHGYGSTGQGGRLKQACQQEFRKWLHIKRIKNYCEGEFFHAGSLKGQACIKSCPSLKKDKDYGKQNDGMTILVLR